MFSVWEGTPAGGGPAESVIFRLRDPISACVAGVLLGEPTPYFMTGLTIAPVKFEGLEAVELLTPAVRLVVVTARGPRLAFLGRTGGPNLLYWAPGKHRRGEWDILGGHRVWITRPGADEAEDTYAADNGPCAVELHDDGVTVTGSIDAVSRLRRGFTVRALRADRFRIDNFVRNEGDMLWSGGLWAITCTVPGPATTYVAPLGDGSNWDYATIVTFRTWGGGHGGVGFADPQFETTGDALMLRPSGRENKRMFKADAGLLALHDPARGVLFAKQVVYQPGRDYPLGTNFALYVGPQNFMVEMESMAPTVTLKPGQTSTHAETWVLTAPGPSLPDRASLQQLFA